MGNPRDTEHDQRDIRYHAAPSSDPKRLSFSHDGTRERVEDAIGKIAARRGEDGECPEVERGTRSEGASVMVHRNGAPPGGDDGAQQRGDGPAL